MSFLENSLKSKNLRVTAPRKAIYEILRTSEKPMSAQEVCFRLGVKSDQQADQASVYRNLSVFSEIGLTHQLQSGKYVVCQNDKKACGQHVHILFMCSSCEKTFEICDHEEGVDELVMGMSQSIGEIKSVSSITLSGNCKDCT